MDYSYSTTQSNTFLIKVYRWMSVALVLSAFSAIYVAATPQLVTFIFSSKITFFALLAIQLALVFVISGFLASLSFPAAIACFILYALLTGVTLSSVFLVYTTASITSAFLVAAGMFAVMSVYGYITQTDLSGLGNILLMALVGLIIAGLVNLFLQSPLIDFIRAGVGVAVFTLLTAYDVQKLKMLGAYGAREKELEKFALLGALTLYLDFINLFLSLLQLMGKRKRD